MANIKCLLLIGILSGLLIGYGESQPFFGTEPPLPTTGVRLFLGEENRIIANFSIVRASQFHDADLDGGGQNDGIWCQSSLNQTMIGSWYLPNGSPVRTAVDALPIRSFNTDITGQVGLLRGSGLGSLQGLYTCVIPNENGINQTLYVAAYGNGEYDNNDGPMVDGVPEFKLLSTRDANPPIFSLSFTVTDRPPTTVTCSVNGNDFTISDNDLIRVAEKTTDPINVTVTVIVRMRVAGLYMCTISNQRTDMVIAGEDDINPSTTNGRNITITGTPSGLTYTRTSVSSVVVSWSGPVDSSIPSGYEVFVINTNDSTSTHSNITTNETQLSLSSLQPDVNYTISVVAFGEENLPSDSINITIPNVVSVVINGPNTPLEYSSEVELTCTADIIIELNETIVDLNWANPNGTVINDTDGDVALAGNGVQEMTTNDSVIYSLDLKFTQLQASHVGTYLCGVAYTDDNDADNIVFVRRYFTISVEVPDPMVTISVDSNEDLNGRNFENGTVILQCFVNITRPLDVPTNVTIKWMGPNGPILNGTRFIINEGNPNDTFYASQLQISPLSLSDNGSEYYCTVRVGAGDSFEQSSLIIPAMNTSNNVSLIVEAIPFPEATIEVLGIPIINESFTVSCVAIIPSDILGIANINVTWIYNDSVAGDDGVLLTSNGRMVNLTFPSVRLSQEGTYTCITTLTIPGIPTVVRRDTEDYEFRTLGDPEVSVFVDGDILAGGIYTLSCSVKLIAGNPNVTWLNEDDELLNSNNNNITISEDLTITDNDDGTSTATSLLIFNPLDYSHIGEYTCIANLTVNQGGFTFNGMGRASITVSVRIPPPTISITTNGSLVRGTVRELTCTVNLISPLPPSFNVSTVIMRDGGPVNDDPRIQSTQLDTTKMLTFIPVNTTDGGEYNCTGSVIPTYDESLIISASNSTTFNGVIEGIPTPIITATTTGSGILGERFIGECSVDVLDDLYDITVNISIIRVNEGILNNSIGSGDISISLLAESLMTSDAGQYQCIVDISQSSINYQFTNVTSFELNTTIPTPNVTISTGNVNPTTLVEGQFIDIVCNVTISEGVNTGIDVSVIWRKDGGSPLTTNTDYTISPLTNIYNMYSSTLRINSLNHGTDNGAVYSCSVTVEPSPSNQFISVNGSNSDSITLTVADFNADHIIEDIIIPFIPTAGDEITLTCNITVPEGLSLTHVPSVTWSYTQDGTQRIDIQNSNAVVSNITRIGDSFYSNLTINPIKTSDATTSSNRRYYCVISFQSLDTIDFIFRELTVKIPPPTVTISGSPSTGPIYESTNYNLTCTATVPSVVDTPVSGSVVWTDPKELTIPVNDRRRIITNVTSSGTNEFTNTLVFLPIDNGDNNANSNDTGTFTCQMTISSDNTNIQSGVNSTTDTVDVEDLPDLQVDVSTSGSTEVGQSFDITFTLRFVERFVTSPTITIMRIGDSNDESHDDITLMDYVTTTDDTGSITNATLVFDPLRFENRGMYIYSVEYNVTGVNNTNDPTTATYDGSEAMNNYTLTVDFPPLNVSIGQDRQGILYAGTPFFFKCYITLSNFVTIPVRVTNQWTRDSVNVPNGDDITTINDNFTNTTNDTYEATLSFNPLDNSDDSGEYTCNVNMMTSFMYVRSTSANASTNITVESLPTPLVDITSSGVTIPGENYMLNCTVTVIDRLIVRPVVVWEKYGGIVSLSNGQLNTTSVPSVPTNISDTTTSLTLSFGSLNTSDAGMYTCRATVNITQINVVIINTDSESLPLQIPTPSLSISLSREQDLLAGSQLTMTCDITVNANVNTPFIVNVTWTMIDEGGNVGSGDMNVELDGDVITTNNNGRITLVDPSRLVGFNQYHSQVIFSTLSSSMDSGMYTCNVSIISNETYNFVSNADTDEVSTNLTVIDPMIGDFIATPDSFLGLETSCDDSDPYDNFTLTCTATKPSVVIPNLEVTWYHNGTIRNGDVTYDNSNTIVTNTLRFPTSLANDSGEYTCHARLIIPDSPTIMVMDNSTITLKAQRTPLPVTNITVTVGQRDATISFTVPSIAYTPETYNINYTGLELQSTLRSTSPEMSPDDITAEDEEYEITLSNLEEANTYNFSVISTNCIGSTSTVVMNFTTLSALPVAPPTNCMNTTFLPRNISLRWSPPLRIDQNGEIMGYNLTCNSAETSVGGLMATQSSPSTAFTINDVVPFTGYTCRLSSINEVGEGPSTMCSFETAQDRPDDAPGNFRSNPTMTNVTFSWNIPATPNGIITGYNLTVVNIDNSTTTSYIITNISPNQGLVSHTVEGFRPYENYTSTVSGSTVVGYGPEAVTSGRTDPDLSTKPILLTTIISVGDIPFISVPVINDTSINITWLPPTIPNGFISSYTININAASTPNTDIIREVTATPDATSYTEIIIGLSPGVPYYVSLYGTNEFGISEVSTTAIVFTKGEMPSIAVSGVTANRSADGRSMLISWNPISLIEARGFFQYQIIVRQVVEDRRRQTSDKIINVPFNESSYNVTGLDPQVVYTVGVRAAVQGEDGEVIEGPTIPPISVTSPAATDPPPQLEIIIPVILVVLIVIIVIVVLVIVIVLCYVRRTGKFSPANNKNNLFELMESSSPTRTTAGVTFRSLDEGPDIINGGGPVDVAPVMTTPADKNHHDDELIKEKKEEGHWDEETILEHMKPIAIASFHEHVQQMHVDSDRGFEIEYKSVPVETESLCGIGRSEANKQRNRFANIFPYDFSRVKLSEIPEASDSDYINANFIDGYNRKDCYIAAQGPLPSTVDDFWRLIWEYRINHIVMLTGVVEGGKKKCEQYWPEKIGEFTKTQNGLSIVMESFVPFADYVIRDLKVSNSNDANAKDLIVSQYHFTSWPDHGVPQFATSLIGFIKRVQKDHNKDKGVPLLVHCSAGVGRTGTFIMLDSLMDRLKVEDSINIYEFLRQLRAKRMYMVQTLAQYVFIHDAMDELTTCGETSVLATNLRARVNKMHKIVPGKNMTGFQEQFELLDQVGYSPNESAFSDAKQSVNLAKNRYPDIVPLNMHRPRLRPDGSTGSDYINASYVDGYKQRNAYIVTQGPLKNTIEDFWRLMMEFRSRTIVQLCSTVEEGEEKCYQYWPTKEGEPVEYGRIKVTLQSEAVSGDYIVRKLLIVNEKGGKTEKEGFVVTQFHYTMWPEHGHPSSTGPIIELIDMLTRAQMSSGNKAITVVCNDGVGRCGAFLCIHSQLERLKTESEVDIFKYLKTARTRRIGLLSELDHYVFCHEVLADFVESFDPYANFKDM